MCRITRFMTTKMLNSRKMVLDQLDMHVGKARFLTPTSHHPPNVCFSELQAALHLDRNSGYVCGYPIQHSEKGELGITKPLQRCVQTDEKAKVNFSGVDGFL